MNTQTHRVLEFDGGDHGWHVSLTKHCTVNLSQLGLTAGMPLKHNFSLSSSYQSLAQTLPFTGQLSANSVLTHGHPSLPLS